MFNVDIKAPPHHIAVGDEPPHNFLAPELSTVDVLFDFLAEGGQHLVVEAVDFREHQIYGEARSSRHFLDEGSHL